MLKSNKVDRGDLRNTLNKVQKSRKQNKTGAKPVKDLRSTIIVKKAPTQSNILRDIEKKIKEKRKQITITIENKPSSTMTALLQRSGLYADKPANDVAMDVSVPTSPVTMRNTVKINPNRIVVEVSNISHDITNEELRSVFREFGAMERMVVKITDGVFNGTVLVTYKHRHSGFALIEKFHNKLVDGRVLRAIHIPEETLSSGRLYSDGPVKQPRITLRDLLSK
ncbi:hypothetical protein HK103_003260 [Boothiomyces macroporosus]|uniref:RRM domain-containing protein n=1 Tax=Boothiomyces macroporosus TaxID=261099 RepID=A0AAD5UIA4_9FUNG|nr:hypothetical protein HK103_003260 [Boothiomyces macroporosus]